MLLLLVEKVFFVDDAGKRMFFLVRYALALF